MLNDDAGKVAQHGFVTAVPDAAGNAGYWLDGRETVEQPNGFVTGPMTLRTAPVGATVNPSELLDGQVCDCGTDRRGGDRRRADRGVPRPHRRRGARAPASSAAPTGGPTILHEDGWMSGRPVNGPGGRGLGWRVSWCGSPPRGTSCGWP